MDSLRYWVTEMHVDGFRFDRASALAREFSDVNKWSSFFDVLHQDPVLSQVKLIAEPWDIGEEGYQVGNFPQGWLEWNGKYRDVMRDFWRAKSPNPGEFAWRFIGSSDIYRNDRRSPSAGINFITAHDGFTLRDLVSYNEKHNKVNGENNIDGENNNRSWNCGIEGHTVKSVVIKLRQKQIRNFLTTLMLSQGIPMLVAGDEFGHSRNGNNNAYCQDNEISWLNWDKMDHELIRFTSRLISLRLEHQVFSRLNGFNYKAINGAEVKEIEWFLPTGDNLNKFDWERVSNRSIGLYLSGDTIPDRTSDGKELKDDNFFIIFNAYHLPVTFLLPKEDWGSSWKLILDTNNGQFNDENAAVLNPRDSIQVEGRSILIMINERLDKSL